MYLSFSRLTANFFLDTTQDQVGARHLAYISRRYRASTYGLLTTHIACILYIL